MEKIQTLAITNFEGRLTRNRIGTLNSGFAKFDTSFGYNPFFKPNQLTWFPNSDNLSVGISNGLVLAGTSRFENGTIATYLITSTGHLYNTSNGGASTSDIRTLTTGSPTFTYGADIIFFGVNTLYIAHDLGVTKIVVSSSGAFVSEAAVGTWDSTHLTPIISRRSFCQFGQYLYVTNSDPSVTYANNIASIILGGTIASYAVLSPSLPGGMYIRDLDISADFTYMLMTVCIIPSELIAPVNDVGNGAAGASILVKWNGTDPGVTTGLALPSFSATALQTFGDSQMMFMYDTFGASLYEGTQKVLTMRNNKSPMPGATCSNGNFITWTSPDFGWTIDTGAGQMYGSLYYYGSLDENSPKGLWRVLRQTSAIGGNIYTMPYNQIVSNRYIGVDTSDVLQVKSSGTHLFSFIDYSGSGGSTNNRIYNFRISPPDESPGGFIGVQAGVYETQNQLFSKKQTIKQIRVYTEPTISGNGFQLDLIGSNGKIITNGTFTYTFASGTDITLLQGALDRINFNPSILDVYSFGLRITNTGSTNMVINKIEVDIEDGGK